MFVDQLIFKTQQWVFETGLYNLLRLFFFKQRRTSSKPTEQRKTQTVTETENNEERNERLKTSDFTRHLDSGQSYHSGPMLARDLTRAS